MVAFFERLDVIDRALGELETVVDLEALLKESASVRYLFKEAIRHERWEDYSVLQGLVVDLRSSRIASMWEAASRGWVDFLIGGANSLAPDDIVAGFGTVVPLDGYGARSLARYLSEANEPIRTRLLPTLLLAIDDGLLSAIREDDLVRIVRQLLESRNTAAAFGLSNAVLQQSRRSPGHGRVTDLASDLGSAWMSDESLQGLSLFCRRLDSELAREHRQPPHDHSRIWRDSIAKSRKSRRDFLDSLVTCVRDLSLSAAGQGNVQPALAVLNSYEWYVFERLRLFLLSRYSSTVDTPKVALAITGKTVAESIETEVELRSLLQTVYPNLSPGQRDDIHEWIRRCSSAIAHRDDEHAAVRARRWERDWLDACGTRELPGSQRKRLHALERQEGPYSDPGPRMVTGFVQQLSPVTDDELQAATGPDELIDLIRVGLESLGTEAHARGWSRLEEVSESGLAEQLRAYFSQDPIRWLKPELVERGPSIVGASLFRAAYENLAERTQDEHRAALSQAVVNAAAGVMGSPEDVQRWAVDALRRAVPSLDMSGCDRARRIASAILGSGESREPDQWADAATQSINESDGLALHLLFELLHRTSGTEDELSARIWDTILVSVENPTPVRRAVWGQWFPLVVLFDHAAATRYMPVIFTSDHGRGTWDGSAWSAYLRFALFHPPTVELLAPVYGRAVRELHDLESRGAESSADGRDWAVQHLAEHIAVAAVQEEAGDAVGSVVAEFLDWAPAPQRRHVAEFLARSLSNSSEVDRSVLRAAQRFFEARAQSQQARRDDELRETGWILEAEEIPLEWRLQFIIGVLDSGTYVEPDHVVLGTVRQHVSDLPQVCVDIVDRMAQSPTEEWQPHSWSEEAREVLERALSADPSLAPQVMGVADRLGQYGLLEFRDVFRAARDAQDGRDELG